MASTSPTPKLVTYSIEIQQHILRNISDIPTLAALIQAYQSIRLAYENHRDTIITSVLNNEIGPDLIQEAYAVEQISSLQRNWDPRRFFEIAAKRPSSESRRVMKWSLEEALAASQLHSTVDLLAHDFIPSVGGNTQSVGYHRGQSHAAAPLSSRILGFKRSFYRFDLFSKVYRCCLDFCSDPRLHHEEIFKLVFKEIPDSKPEQLVGLTEHLYRCLVPGNYVPRAPLRICTGR
ncbi:predicted protein [Uncinocarpus reesii 1704]|uniref:Uncharacterized protein n=1 Tax=Uncinocarpus reesii (strain UAMH 1704) TaxID=336963 RepID=C4JMU7_UNCRE|nr:uncharacterized protein UREG_04155 [Uncinocarpus reesii 1704]EEP79309.1 predicted protein [Uncinocarpus reesii 1704]